MLQRPDIAIAGLACATSSFSPARTLAPAFHPCRGKEVIDKYPFLHPATALGDAADWRGALNGYALPGSVVTQPAFEELADEIIARLGVLVASTTVHGLWYNIHGAMCVEGLDDVEAELLRRIRRVVGPKIIVSASMDLHGNVSEEPAQQTDLITCYRLAPHEDAMDTYGAPVATWWTCRPQKQRTDPSLKACVTVPILPLGEQTSTRLDPAKSIYAMVPQVE